MKRLSVITLALIFLAAVSVAADERRSLIRENALLEKEQELAGKTKVYFIFDLAEAKISLKVRGVALREFSLSAQRIWGDPVVLERAALRERSAIQPPVRPEIKPQKEEDQSAPPSTSRPASGAAPELEALELKDMPMEYRLDFGGGLIVHIKNRPGGFWGRLNHVWYNFKATIFSPASVLWHTILGKRYTAVYLFMAPEDAQALYWSLPEGTEAIVRGR